MLNNTIERLRAMKMSAFADELERQLEDNNNYNQLGFGTDCHCLWTANGTAGRTTSCFAVSEMRVFPMLRQRSRALNTSRTGIWIRAECCDLRLAAMLMKGGILL